MKRKIEHLMKKLREYTDLLDHATTRGQIKEALKMKRLYESALLALEEAE